MTSSTRPRGNPFSEQGVSRYPSVAPMVGQREVFACIEDMIQVMRSETGSCFRAVYGDWGIGKTRLAHELVGEACGQSKGWIIRTGNGQARKCYPLGRIRETGIVPAFTTFADILSAAEEGIDLRSALPKAACVALTGLAQLRGRDFQVHMAAELQRALLTIEPSFSFDELAYTIP